MGRMGSSERRDRGDFLVTAVSHEMGEGGRSVLTARQSEVALGRRVPALSHRQNDGAGKKKKEKKKVS